MREEVMLMRASKKETSWPRSRMPRTCKVAVLLQQVLMVVQSIIEKCPTCYFFVNQFYLTNQWRWNLKFGY